MQPGCLSLPPKLVVQEECVTLATFCSPFPSNASNIYNNWIKDVRGYIPAYPFDGPVVHGFL